MASLRTALLAATLAAVLVVPTFAQTPQPQQPPTGALPQPAPGHTLVFTRPLEPDKWQVTINGNGAQRIYRCKPLACADFEQVIFDLRRSPVQHPDPKALQKYATVELPKSIRAGNAAQSVMAGSARKVEIMSSKTTTLRDYPSVLNETKYRNRKTTLYVQSAIIFAGPVLIQGSSASPDRALSKKTLDEFVNNMKIVVGPPVGGAPAAAPPAPKPNQGI